MGIADGGNHRDPCKGRKVLSADASMVRRAKLGKYSELHYPFSVTAKAGRTRQRAEGAKCH